MANKTSSRRAPTTSTADPELTKQIEEAVGRAIAPLVALLKHETGAEQWTIAQTCDYLKISRQTFHSLVNRGRITITKAGRRTLVDANAIRRGLADGLFTKYERSNMG